MLTSRAFGGLAKLLEALREHAPRIVETLAEQQAPSRDKPVAKNDGGKGAGGSGERSEGVSAPAKALLEFSPPRDPTALAAFINLRALNPEHEHWRRGVEAAVSYTREHGDLRVPFTFRVPAVDDQEAEATGWPASLAGLPLGQWTAARRFSRRPGALADERPEQLEEIDASWCPAAARDRAPVSPASTGRSLSRRRAGPTRRPSRPRTPTSPPFSRQRDSRPPDPPADSATIKASWPARRVVRSWSRSNRPGNCSGRLPRAAQPATSTR
ncbi:Helicase associated domain protein [Streptomyces sp. NPDC058818]|uniref:helicase associated domain-containing protein n=1 Tax=Streptomyces sp. NPDC058818 TaxID=3346640 RepID=UPI0036CD4ADC